MEIKQLHPMIAAQLKLILQRNDIAVEESHIPGKYTYKVFDFQDKELITCEANENGDSYTIHALGELAAYIKVANRKPTPGQRNVLDTIDLIKKKYDKQKADNALSVADRRLMNMLSQYTSENSGK